MAAPVAKTPAQSEAINRQISDWNIAGLTGEEIADRLAALDPPIVMTATAVRIRIGKMNQRAVTNREEYIAQELLTLRLAERKTAQALLNADLEQIASLASALKGVSESRRKLLGLDSKDVGSVVPITPDQLAAMSDDELTALITKMERLR